MQDALVGPSEQDVAVLLGGLHQAIAHAAQMTVGTCIAAQKPAAAPDASNILCMVCVGLQGAGLSGSLAARYALAVA